MITAIRLINYKCFEDSGWINLNPLTLLYGYNSSGKSSVLKVLLMLKQSLNSASQTTPFVFSDENGVDLGNYKDVVYSGLTDRQIEIHLKLKIQRAEERGSELFTIRIRLAYDYKTKINIQTLYEIRDESKIIFSLSREPSMNAEFNWHSDTYPNFFASSENIQLGWVNFLPIISGHFSQFSKEFHSVTSTSMLINNALRSYFYNLINIGPLRTVPKRNYRFTGENPTEVGNQGQNTYNLLYNNYEITNNQVKANDQLIHKVNKWLSGYHYILELDKISDEITEFSLIDTRSKNKI